MPDIDWGFATPAIIAVVCILTVLCTGLVETEDHSNNNGRDE